MLLSENIVIRTVSTRNIDLIEAVRKLKAAVSVNFNYLNLNAHFNKLLGKMIGNTSAADENCRFHTFFAVRGAYALEKFHHVAV